MHPNTKNLLKEDIATALSEILPELAQVFQKYEVSSTVEIHLTDLSALDLAQEQMSVSNKATCCFHSGVMKCTCDHEYASRPQVSDIGDLNLSLDQAIQFSDDIGSKLTTILPGLSQFSGQVDQNFEVHFLLDPAIANSGQPVVCQCFDNSLRCEIGECSDS